LANKKLTEEKKKKGTHLKTTTRWEKKNKQLCNRKVGGRVHGEVFGGENGRAQEDK